MSPEHTVNHLKSQGRNGDTELIHVSKDELKGLQDIMLAHGGSLTINPSTGLPEAYNFGSILNTVAPIAIGAGLTAVSGGALSPLAAAMITGAGYGLATGDMQQGLVAGLGAWGGAGIGAGLAEAGGTALAEQGAEQGARVATEAAGSSAPMQSIMPQGYNPATSGFSPTEMAQGSLSPSSYSQLQAPASQAQAINATNFPNLNQAQLQGFQQSIPNAANPEDITRAAGMANATQGAGTSYPGMMKAGLGQMGTGQFISNNYAPMLASLVPALATQSTQPQYGTGSTYTAGANTMRLSPNFKGYTPPPPVPYWKDRMTYAAGGGLMAIGGQAQDMNQNQMYPGSQLNDGSYATPSQIPQSTDVVSTGYEPRIDRYSGQMLAGGGSTYLPKSPDVSLSKFTDSDPDTANKDALTATMLRLQKLGKSAKVPVTKLAATNVKGLGDIGGDTTAAHGGLSNLGGYSDGGRLLKGPGDGVSDSIPAQIGAKQPARLADGEFVIPARIVSEIGNGSTDAGARKLYAMMDRVQKKRRATKNVAANTKADKYLPA